MKIPNVFKYNDYHRYLRDYWILRKEKDSSFSYARFGENIGMDKSHLFRMINSDLNISYHSARKISEFMKLNDLEKDYFLELVLLKTAKRPDDKRYYMAKLLKIKEKAIGENKKNKPKVFISYSMSDEKHTKWVKQFAERLAENGVDVVFDQWDLKQGNDISVFIERMESEPGLKKVFVICDKTYVEKANKRIRGVGMESIIISNKIYKDTSQEKYIPIIMEFKDGEPLLPTFFEGRLGFDFSNDEVYNKSFKALIKNLFNLDKRRPKLGSPPRKPLDKLED